MPHEVVSTEENTGKTLECSPARWENNTSQKPHAVEGTAEESKTNTLPKCVLLMCLAVAGPFPRSMLKLLQLNPRLPGMNRLTVFVVS